MVSEEKGVKRGEWKRKEMNVARVSVRGLYGRRAVRMIFSEEGRKGLPLCILGSPFNSYHNKLHLRPDSLYAPLPSCERTEKREATN
mmetsp:Transcript_24160/g.47497  ORF Transcript_24160/g.47497 Transcript_24160/m.47497 type:complete len:87 (-) Transcript_24160:1386-1646(-)